MNNNPSKQFSFMEANNSNRIIDPKPIKVQQGESNKKSSKISSKQEIEQIPMPMEHRGCENGIQIPQSADMDGFIGNFFNNAQ